MRNAKVFRSEKDGLRMLAPQPGIRFEADAKTENGIINLYPDRRYQEVLGFGGAFTETSAYNYARMSPENQRKIIAAYFDRETGLGLNFCRTHIHSCDFSLSRYTYVDEGDRSLDSFSIDRDREYVIPFIQAARQTAGDLRLFASPWSPPAWMKDNHDLCHGGRLLDEYYDTWARYFARYLQAYKKEGIDFFAVSVQNEAMAWQTWESCLYTAREEARFACDCLRPALDAAGFEGVRILIWDHNKERVYDRARDTFRYAGAKESIWGIAFHWYSGDHFAALDMTHEILPDKPLILSEFCLGGSRGEVAKGPHSSWIGVEKYAHEMIGNFNHHMAASVDWNMLVDETGGPFHDRPRGCKAQIVVDPDGDTVSLEPTYYAVGHFSRFVRPGAVRIGSSCFDDGMNVTAFENPDGSLVAVLLNATQKTRDVRLRLGDTTAPLTLPRRSLTTCVVEVAP